CFAFGRDHADLCRADSRFDVIEFACDEDIEVTGHRWRDWETHFFAAGDFFLALHRHVRYGDPALRNDSRQFEARPKSRFIPAGKKPAGISRFKLRSEHDLPRAAPLLLITHVKESLPLLIDFARNTKLERVISGHKFR